MKKEVYHIEKENDWAKNVKGSHVFIDGSDSGRKGYYCIGCSKEMEAVIQKKNPNRKSFFRHVPVDIKKGEIACAFSNREYRELLATDVLQRVKRIKVPAVYKFPPKSITDPPNLLQPSKFITAHKVRSQVWFYEDADGNIKHDKNPDINKRHLLFRPDVVFFDSKGKAILFIELVVTHKINDEKRIKLSRLGIDTISVIVPRSSEQDIEDNFKTTQRTKWEYNGIEADTEYLPVSTGTSAGILEIDEEQRRIFEEGYTCRKSRLGNTIRTIERCLGAKSYRRFELQFEQEISRIEKATKGAFKKLGRLEDTGRKEIDLRLGTRRKEIAIELGKFEEARSKFEEEEADLENRYSTKDREIRENQKQTYRDIEIGGENEGEGASIKERLRKERDLIESRIKEIRGRTKQISKSRDSLPDRFRQRIAKAKGDFGKEKSRVEDKIARLQTELDNFENTIRKEEERGYTGLS